MIRNIEDVLTSALERKPKRLSFDSTYNHKNIKDWLQSILPRWNIVFPNVEKDSSLTETQADFSTELEGPCALSEWPTVGDCRNGVKKYLEDQNYNDPDDLIDGACEPLAFYLSNYIRNEKHKNSNMVIDTHHLFRLQREAKHILDRLPPDISAPRIFAKYLRQEVLSPNYWEDVRAINLNKVSFKDYLFGHDLAKTNVLKVIESHPSTLVKCIPLYVLCYLFDTDELTNIQLKNTSEETAQYSLHVIGLVIDSASRTVIVADPNGALEVGSNMEFLSMPLTKLEIKATTCVSRYDREVQKKANEQVQEKANQSVQEMKLEDMNGRGNEQVQAQAQVKEMKAKRIRDIEAMKLEEANSRWNELSQAKAQVKEMKAKRLRDIEAKMLRIRDITGEGEEDQNANAQKARIDEAY
jgi:hypothetical protein